MKDSTDEIPGILELEPQMEENKEQIEHLTAELAATDQVHNLLVDRVTHLETRVDTSDHDVGGILDRVANLEAQLQVAEHAAEGLRERVTYLEAQLQAALFPEDIPLSDDEEEPFEDEPLEEEPPEEELVEIDDSQSYVSSHDEDNHVWEEDVEVVLVAENQQPACTFKTFMDCKPHTFSGAEGAVGLLRWFEKVESVFAMCNYPLANQVKFASGTLEGPALTWWNAQEYCPRDEIQKLEGEFWNLKMEGSEIELYTPRSHELATMCPHMVTTDYKRIELYIRGLVPQIQSTQQRRFEPTKNFNQTTSSSQNKGGYAGKYPKCNKCNFHHFGVCNHCQRCGKIGHAAKDCRGELQAKQHFQQPGSTKGCFECGKEGHFRKNCSQLKKGGNGCHTPTDGGIIGAGHVRLFIAHG
ncbi:hypothetical protein L1987_30154 [Smallanthus sonchifolius]|uniref:Uncharacterized protein n=1 Tax=Smallanthus sonchifolius TaxID=185202 RepID=A0ACB9I3I6_9ASTR|nr:hypothetical protein L1987_30154 [Smallanthus sonchifolius]